MKLADRRLPVAGGAGHCCPALPPPRFPFFQDTPRTAALASCMAGVLVGSGPAPPTGAGALGAAWAASMLLC